MHVLIIGGGIGGLSLGQALKHAHIPFSLFERDASAGFRPQGYRIRVNPDGAAALKTCLPPATFTLFQQTCAVTKLGGSFVNGATGKVENRIPGFGNHMRGAGPGGASRGSAGPSPGPGGTGSAGRTGDETQDDEPNVYTVDRTRLRQVLMQGIEDDINFGKTLLRYRIEGEGVVADFSDGSSASGTLLVGADGLHSVVRKQFLPDDVRRIVDTDGRAIYGKTFITPKLLEHFPAEAMEWMTIISGTISTSASAPSEPGSLNGTSNPLNIFLEPIRFPANAPANFEHIPDYIYWVLTSNSTAFYQGLPAVLPGTSIETVSQDEGDRLLLNLSKTEARALSLELAKGFHSSIRSLLELQTPEQSAVLRAFSAVPTVKDQLTSYAHGDTAPEACSMTPWAASPYITLVGDAIHPMSPTGGSGANTSLRDVARLFIVLQKAYGSAESADALGKGIAQYEQEMRDYAGAALQGSYQGAKKFFGAKPLEECRVVDM